jgi:SAM-dependent methyltransferase
VRQDRRGPFERALRQARIDAYPSGQYVGQESFMTADEIRILAERSRIGPSTSVLDVCCGVAGPGRLIAAERRCTYLGVDYSSSALAIARARSVGLNCRFVEALVPPVPDGPFDAVLLLETMLAFVDPLALLDDVSGALAPGGMFACTVEAGAPLTAVERALMPDADTVHLVDVAALIAAMTAVGLSVTWAQQRTSWHLAIATALLDSFRCRSAEIARLIGRQALDDLLDAHRLWVQWLSTGRVRKYALVARKQCVDTGRRRHEVLRRGDP